MLWILAGIVLAIICSVALWFYSESGYGLRHTIAFIAAACIGMGAGFASVAYAFAVSNWIGSAYKADIVNREYKTDYTREEIFWASDVIETIRELDRKRVEVNGDVMRDKPEPPK